MMSDHMNVGELTHYLIDHDYMELTLSPRLELFDGLLRCYLIWPEGDGGTNPVGIVVHDIEYGYNVYSGMQVFWLREEIRLWATKWGISWEGGHDTPKD